MGKSGSASPEAQQQHSADALRDHLNPHGWLDVTQGRSTAMSWGVRTNRRVNLTRSRSGLDTLGQTARRLRAVR
jgi:hypothetical protein